MASLFTLRTFDGTTTYYGSVYIDGKRYRKKLSTTKSTAAHRAGLKHILAPAQNEKDLEEIPEKVLKDLKISFVKDVSEVLKLSLDIDANNVAKQRRRTSTTVSAQRN